MKRFKNILLIHEEGVRGEAACTRAATLAKENQAQLTVVEVIEEMPADARRLMSVWRPLLMVDPQEIVVRERQEQLAQCIESIQQQGVEGDTKLLVGDPFLEVTREVLRNGHDLVIMTAEGKCRVKEWLFGTTSMRLMRKCPCPVWVVKPAHHEPYARILAAVDTDPDDDSQDALNSTIMDLATSLAQLEQSVLHVVHVWALFGEQLLHDSGRVPENQLGGWLRNSQDRHQTALDRLLGKYDLTKLEHRIHLHKGEPESAIPELTRAEQVDLIVMGTVCRTGIAGFFIGNTAERILQQVDCSVLTVKPEGFVSPVTVSTHRQPQVDGESDVQT
jgi:nucleotide-binding universal stress UspA family protein